MTNEFSARPHHSQLLEQPSYRSFLYLYILWVPHGMDGVTDGSEYDPSLPEVVSPSGNRLGAEILESKAVDILRLHNDVFRILIVGHIVLLIVDHERAHAVCDGMLILRSMHLERTQRRVTDVGSAHYLTVVLGAERYMAAVVQSIEATAGSHELFDRRSLLVLDPHDGLGIGEGLRRFQIRLIRRGSIRSKIAVGPDHAVAQDQE